ncbi:MAG: ATP-binding protein [Sphingomonadales bacterium]|nr:ATP-binding protein [Sphingomonadales bacterium]MBD3774426.1 ATP-binding protein [Paracoccaceae bacterium]
MADQGDPLARIADALDRLAPPPPAQADWRAFPAYVWDGRAARGVARIDAPALEQLRGIDQQKARVAENVRRLANGVAAHDMLLWGARGMGKSALVRSAVLAAQADMPGTLALVQAGAGAFDALPALFARLGEVDRRFLVFIDDLGFADDDTTGPRQLRSWLEGGVEARPANIRLAVTANRRAIVARHMAEQDDPINPRDVTDDKLALADRFGIALGFHVASQDVFLEIVATYAAALGLDFEESEAIEWAAQRGARSGRSAWQFVTELAGRAGASA